MRCATVPGLPAMALALAALVPAWGEEPAGAKELGDAVQVLRGRIEKAVAGGKPVQASVLVGGQTMRFKILKFADGSAQVKFASGGEGMLAWGNFDKAAVAECARQSIPPEDGEGMLALLRVQRTAGNEEAAEKTYGEILKSSDGAVVARARALWTELAPPPPKVEPVSEPPKPAGPWEEALAPGVNQGLAAKYAGDAGIAKDPDVFAFEDFETGAVALPHKEGHQWEDVMQVVKTAPFLGKFCAESVWPKGRSGGASRFWFPKEAHRGAKPAYFLRAYRKFDRSFFPGDVSKAVGLKGMGICCLKCKFDGRGGATAGGTCDGTNWYTVEDQFVGWAGKGAGSQDGYYWFGHMYSYMPFPKEVLAKPGDIKVNDLPTTRFSCYGVPREYIQYDKWYCFELGLYLNTPGKRDGEARYWINGVLQARTVNMCFRTVEDAYPEVATLNLYRTTEDFPQTMKLWMDNIVIARKYIGPAKTP